MMRGADVAHVHCVPPIATNSTSPLVLVTTMGAREKAPIAHIVAVPPRSIPLPILGFKLVAAPTTYVPYTLHELVY